MQMKLLLACIPLLVSSTTIAQQMNVNRGDISKNNVEENTVKAPKANENLLSAWGIDEQEYKRFLHLKENTPRGYFTPGTNPLYYLGIEARNEAERKKYAKKIARLEFKNVMKVQQFSRAVQQASAELFGKGMIADYAQGQAFTDELSNKANVRLSQAFNPSAMDKEKISFSKIVFVKENCSPCDREYKKSFNLLKNGKIAQLQVVFPEQDNDKIVDWALRMEVPKILNQSGRIVLRGQEEGENPDSYPSTQMKMM